MLTFLAWRIKHALPIITCTRSFILHYLSHHPSTNAKLSMFTEDSSSTILTNKGMDLGTCGLTMPTQSNAHNSEEVDIFWTPSTMMERWLDISE